MMRFALLASGSKGNCFLLREGEELLMIDCGTTGRYLKESFASLGITKEDLSAVLITHSHTDHIAQIARFADLPVYAPLALPCKDCRRVEPFTPLHLGGLDITPLPLSHDAPETTGYVFEDGSQKLVYITDTGYLQESYLPRLTDADYIVLESNHDVEMLMASRRPQYVKSRIYGDYGHLNNEDCAKILDRIVTPRTRMIVLAHISQETNTRQKALDVSAGQLLNSHRGDLNPRLVLCAAGQYEIIRGGGPDEEMVMGSCSRALGLERMADR
jgi:phosphoribosyl 1,2-cyclic phosphodiesterase